ncbi:hypothetical protein [Nocardioides sp.]|uniref:hypothetical protein n=1 Tax=Nocardioides sp. TaxID=35761 RepID=UPI003D11D952
MTTFWMAKQLGFVVIAMDRQFAGEVDEDDVAQVRSELHFHDLVRGAERSIRVYERLESTLPRICTEVSDVWRRTCLFDGYAALFEHLRKEKRYATRRDLMTELRALATQHGLQGGW